MAQQGSEIFTGTARINTVIGSQVTMVESVPNNGQIIQLFPTGTRARGKELEFMDHLHYLFQIVRLLYRNINIGCQNYDISICLRGLKFRE